MPNPTQRPQKPFFSGGSQMHSLKRFFILAFASFALLPNMGAVETVEVFESGQGGYAFYRIPSIIRAADGSLLAFAEGRVNSGADHGDIDLVLRRSQDHGLSWGPMNVVWDDGGNTCGNPTPVLDQSTGRLWLAMTHNQGEDDLAAITSGTGKGSRTVWMSHSDDHGVTWAAPRDLTASVKKPEWRWFATGPGTGIQLRCGRLVIPACRNTGKGGKATAALVFYSDDHGKTWQIGGEAGDSLSESQVVELADGSVMLNARRTAARPHQRGVAISKDRGETFGPVWHDPALVDPTCQASILRCSLAAEGQGNRLIFSNPATDIAGRWGRKNLTLRMSLDEGKTWPVARLLHPGFSAYSSLVMLSHESIGCLFESGGDVKTERYQRITFAKFTLSWLMEGDR
jgi:sialidase-1